MVDNPTGGAFNPTDQQVAVPDWLHLAKGIEAPKADASLGNLFEGIGKVGNEAIVVADNLTKFDLEDKIHSGIDAIRDKYTQDAQNTLAAIKNQNPNVNTVPGSTTSLFAQSIEAKLPTDLKNLPQKLDTLDAAKSSGKYSPTFLDMQYDALAKDFRSRYPGYRDYIDQQFEKSTGTNPANAMVRSLLSDINSFVTNKNAEKEKVNSVLREAVAKGMPLLGTYAAHTAGTISDVSAMGVMNANMAQQYEWMMKEKARTAYKGDLEQETLLAQQIMPKRAVDIAAAHFKDIAIADPQNDNKPIMLDQFISEVQSGKRPTPNSQEWELIGNLVSGNLRETEAHIRSEFNQVNPTTKRSWMEAGGDKSEKSIKDALTLHTLLDTAIRNKDTGMAAGIQRLNEAKGNDALHGVYEAPGGEAIALAAAVAKVSDKALQSFFDRGILSFKNLPQMDQETLTKLATKLHFNDLRLPTAPTYTPTQQLKDAKAAGTSKAGLNAVTREAEALTDPQVPILEKIGIAKGMVDPTNADYLKLFNEDKIEAGKVIEGRNTIFNRWSHPGVTQTMWDLSKKTGNRQLWEDYKTRVQDWVGTDLLPRDIATLNLSNETKGQQEKAKISYDSKAIEFSVDNLKTLRITNPNNAASVGKAVQHINDYIRNLAAIAKQEGKDPNEYVIGIMNHTRGMINMEHVKQNTPAVQMIKSAITAHSPPEEKPAATEERKPEPVMVPTAPDVTPALPPKRRSRLTPEMEREIQPGRIPLDTGIKVIKGNPGPRE